MKTKIMKNTIIYTLGTLVSIFLGAACVAVDEPLDDNLGGSYSCRDNIVNGNEECEPVNNDFSQCDGDCTFPVCGDGYFNSFAAEECDDANNTSDGNGCSATCTLVADQYEPNDTSATATVLTVGAGKQFHGATAAAEVDYFSVVVADTSLTYDFCIGNPKVGSTLMVTEIYTTTRDGQLLDTDGATVLSSNEVRVSFEINEECITHNFAATGTYYYKVTANAPTMYYVVAIAN